MLRSRFGFCRNQDRFALSRPGICMDVVRHRDSLNLSAHTSHLADLPPQQVMQILALRLHLMTELCLHNLQKSHLVLFDVPYMNDFLRGCKQRRLLSISLAKQSSVLDHLVDG